MNFLFLPEGPQSKSDRSRTIQSVSFYCECVWQLWNHLWGFEASCDGVDSSHSRQSTAVQRPL